MDLRDYQAVAAAAAHHQQQQVHAQAGGSTVPHHGHHPHAHHHGHPHPHPHAQQQQQQQIPMMVSNKFKPNQKYTALGSEAQRLTIAYLFEHHHQGNPDRERWKGKDGIIPQLRELLGLNKNHDIAHILEEYLSCKDRGVKYTGQRRINQDSKPLGRPVALTADSHEAKILKQVLQERGRGKGAGVKAALQEINAYRKSVGQNNITYSAVDGLARRMKLSPPIRRKVQKSTTAQSKLLKEQQRQRKQDLAAAAARGGEGEPPQQQPKPASTADPNALHPLQMYPQQHQQQPPFMTAGNNPSAANNQNHHHPYGGGGQYNV